MMRARRVWLWRVLLSCVICAALAVIEADATTFVLMDEDELAARSEAVISGVVRRVDVAADDMTGGVYTYVALDVDDMLAGSLDGTAPVLRERGGQLATRGERIFGSAEYRAGEHVIVFATRDADGWLRTTAMAMGKFTVTDESNAGATATRDLGSEVVVLDPRTGRLTAGPVSERHNLRAFTTRIRTAVLARRAAKAVQLPPPTFQAEFKFLSPTAPARWFEPDDGVPIAYRIDSTGYANIGPQASHDAVVSAFAAWSDISSASITLTDGGPMDPVGFNGCANGNRVIFNDPAGEIDDPVKCAGVLAVGGYCTSDEQRTINGTTFRRIMLGKVTFNNGWENCAVWTPCNLAEVATHELGHTIGFGHSDDGNATMAAFAHFDGRCASVMQDDMDAATFTYPLAVTPGPSPTFTRTPTPALAPSMTSTAVPLATSMPSPSATPSRTATRVPTATPTLTATSTSMHTSTPIASSTPTSIRTSTPTASSTPTGTSTSTPTASSTSTPTRTASPTATATPTDLPTATPTATATASPTATATATWTTTATPSATPTATATDTATVTVRPSPIPTYTPTSTATPTVTNTATPSPTRTPTFTRTPTATSTLTPMRTSTRTPTATRSPTQTPTSTPTATASPSATASMTPSVTATATPTASPSATASATSIPTLTATSTSTPTATATATMIPTRTPSAIRSRTPTPTSSATSTSAPTATSTTLPTATATSTPTNSPTMTATPTATRTSSPTFTASPTSTRIAIPTRTATAARTATPSLTRTPSATATVTASSTPSPTPTATRTSVPSATQTARATSTPSPMSTATPSSIPSRTASPSNTPTDTATQTASPTATATATATATVTATPTATRTVTATATPSATATHTATEPASFTAVPTATLTPTATDTATSAPTETPEPPATPTSTTVPQEILSGRIVYYGSIAPVPDVTVRLSDANAPATRTGANGFYTFDVAAGGTYAIAPEKVDGDTRALSALDAAYVLQAMSGRRALDPFQAQLCDVTGDGHLDALDAAAILDASVGAGTRFSASTACGSDWLFTPTSAAAAHHESILPDLDGGCRNGAIAWEPADGSPSGQDFIAGRIGDCTGNWPDAVTPNNDGGAGADEHGSARLGRLQRMRGADVRLPLFVRQDGAFYSIEADIAYDPSHLRVVDVHPRPHARDAVVTMNATAPGRVRVALASAQPITRPNAAVLVVEFARVGRQSTGMAPAIAALRIDEHAVVSSADATR